MKLSSSPPRSRSRMRGLSRDNKAILREFGDQSIDHIGKPATTGDDGALSLIGGAVVEYLGDYVQLRPAAQPVCNRLKLPRQLVQFITKRRCRPGIVSNHVGVQAIPGGAPLVVMYNPG